MNNFEKEILKENNSTNNLVSLIYSQSQSSDCTKHFVFTSSQKRVIITR